MSIRLSSIRALLPRGLQHYSRNLGAGSRVEIQVLQTANVPIRTIASLVPGFSSLLRFSSGLEERIQLLQIDRGSLAEENFNLALENASLRGTLEQYRKWFECSPMGFHVLSPDGKIKDVNQHWLKLLGYPKEEVVGRSIFDFISPVQRVNAEERFLARVQQNPIPKKTKIREFVARNGRKIYVETMDTVFRNQEGGAVEVQTAFIDITEKVLAQRALRKAKKVLVDIERRAAVGELAASISHTYKNQIMQLSGIIQQTRARLSEFDSAYFAMRAKMKIGEPVDGEISNIIESKLSIGMLVDKIEEASSEMATVVRGILSLSRVGSNKKVFIPVVKTVNEITAALKALAEKEGIRLEKELVYVDDSFAVFMPETAFQDVLRNLLINAIEAFASSGLKAGEKVIKLTVKKASDGILQFEIEDNAGGIDPRVFHGLLKKQVHSTKKEGTGLGLLGVKRSLEAAKGDIKIINNPGRGVKILVFMPFSKTIDGLSVAQEEASPVLTPEMAAKIRVLLIEDEEHIRALYLILLKRIGFSPVPIGSAAELGELLSRGEIFDLVITDQNLPDGNGTDFIKQMRAKARDRNMKFVLVSGDGDIVPDAGIAFVKKPFKPEEFIGTISSLAMDFLTEASQK